MDLMDENFRGELTSENLPCIRSTLDECDSSKVDRCWDYCCPAGYRCARNPIVGLVCMDGTTECGTAKWCRDFVDIPRSCKTEVCQNKQMVARVTTWAYVLAAIGIVLDLVDVFTIFTLPDAVVFKSFTNIFSSLVKFIAVGVMMGAGTQGFMSELHDAKCYNIDGMQMTSDA